MREIDRIWLKYEEGRFFARIQSLDEVNRLALTFGSDVAQTLRLLTLLCNPDRNPSGYGLSDAPLIGLLTRVAKLFRLVCKFYEIGNADYLSVFSRPLIESAIVATCSDLRTSGVELENIAVFGSDYLRTKWPLGSHYLRMSAH